MKIIVTFAVASEFTRWRRYSRFTRIDCAGTPVHRARVGDIEIYALMTGIGMRRSQRELQQLLAARADLCIASGLAGGLKKQHRVGAIVVARGIKTEAHTPAIASDSGLVDVAIRCGANPVDFFYTSKAVVNSPSERLRLAKSADAVDMESFHVLDEAHRAGVRAVAVRAISDSAEKTLPMDFDRVVNKHGEVGWLPILIELAKQPMRFAGFVRFGIDSSGAARNLARFLDRYVNALTITA